MDTRLTEDHHESLRLWLRLLTCTSLIENQVRKSLATQFKTTLPRFDLMAQLERTPDGLQMGELSRRMLVTGGNVTGIVDQLERAGLIARGRQAQWRPARLAATPLREVADWVEQYRRFWEQSFDRLDEYLKQLQAREPKHGRTKD